VYEAVIATPNNRILTRGTVTVFAVRSPFITGYTSSEGMAKDIEPPPVTGYFLIDTTNGTVIDGLTETEWRQKLLELRWEHPALRDAW